MNTQPPPVEELTNLYLNTPSGDEDYAPHIYEKGDVPLITNNPLLSNDLNKDEMAPSCVACQLCRDPNSDTDDYRFCIYCNCDITPTARSRWISKPQRWINLLLHIWIFATVGKSTIRKPPVLIVRMLSFVFCVKHKLSRRNFIQQRSLLLHANLRK